MIFAYAALEGLKEGFSDQHGSLKDALHPTILSLFIFCVWPPAVDQRYAYSSKREKRFLTKESWEHRVIFLAQKSSLFQQIVHSGVMRPNQRQLFCTGNSANESN